MDEKLDSLSIVIPVYNEEETIKETIKRLNLVKASASSYLNVDFVLWMTVLLTVLYKF